ncbi:MAG: hypothetical protein LAT65_05935 [Saccharospirillum sp.]|nr:hypothetical protein [Saccharospirillum sp.]
MSNFELKLEAIDDSTRSDHYHLIPGDNCLYLCEYRSGGGYNYRSNQLIYNIKKSVSKRYESHYQYKLRDMRIVALALAKSLADNLDDCLFVPAPSSKARIDPDYDDRLLKILTRTSELRVSSSLKELNICDCLHSRESRDSFHQGKEKRNIEDLRDSIAIDIEKIPSTINRIIIFDDMITTGCTFKASQQVLNINIGIDIDKIDGLFIARRILPPPEDDFDVSAFFSSIPN